MWMDLENIMLSEKIRERQILITYMWNLKNKTNSVYSKTVTDSQYRKLTSGSQWGEGGAIENGEVGGTNYWV